MRQANLWSRSRARAPGLVYGLLGREPATFPLFVARPPGRRSTSRLLGRSGTGCGLSLSALTGIGRSGWEAVCVSQAGSAVAESLEVGVATGRSDAVRFDLDAVLVVVARGAGGPAGVVPQARRTSGVGSGPVSPIRAVKVSVAVAAGQLPVAGPSHACEARVEDRRVGVSDGAGRKGKRVGVVRRGVG